MISFSSIYKEFIKKSETNESDNNILFIIPITKKLNDLNFSQFNEIYIIIDNLLKDSELNLEKEINSLIKKQSDEIIEVIHQFVESEIKLSKNSILNEKKCFDNYNIFHNENLCKMINSLEIFTL